MKRRGGERMSRALLASAALHAAVGVLLWAATSGAEPLPELRVYAVDIVSPPPQELGEFDPEPGSPPEPVAEPEPEPEPAPPEPEPEPEPTPPPPKAEPVPAPKPRKEEPKPPPKKEEPKPEPKKETPPTAPPKREEPKKEEPKPAPSEAKPTPSRGAQPDPSSSGGEDLDVKIEGARFVDPDYLANIQRQINRYFRRPSASRTDVAEVQFYINKNGSVSDIEVVRHSGSFAFRVAAMEAVEQAGINKAFGPLPREYPADQLLVSFYFRPAR